MLPFNDVSYAQGQYNMDADPNQAIMMKASGYYTVAKTPYLDSQLVNNYANATRLGKVPFMYHFAGGADPVVEASYFISAVSPLAVGDGYALDFEIDTPDNPGWCLAFLDHFTAVVGTRPWFYVDRSRRENGDWSAVQAKYGEWITAPDVPFSADIPNVGVYIAQQGPIVGGHDTDMFFGGLDSLKAYTYSPPPVPDEPIPSRPAPSPAPVPAPLDPPAPAPVEPTPSPAPEPAPDSPEPETPPSTSPPEPVVVPSPTTGFWRSLLESIKDFLKELNKL